MKENHSEMNGQTEKTLRGELLKYRERRSDTKGQYKKERHGKMIRGELLKCREKEKPVATPNNVNCVFFYKVLLQ